MRIWLLHVGEELPVDKNPRLFRYGHLAQELSRRGHQVLRWAPTFQHFRKCQRFNTDQRQSINSQYAIQFVHAPGYRRNVSFARLASYRTLAQRFRALARVEQRPDLILSGLPSLEWCEAAVDFGHQNDIPVVLDVRDRWPDIYLQVLPHRLRWLGRWAIAPAIRRAAKMLQRADAISAVSKSYLDWGLAHAGREQGSLDQVFPLGFQPCTIAQKDRDSSLVKLQQLGVDPNKIICCYVGLLERSYDIKTMILAAQQLERDFPGKFQFVICGAGSKSKQTYQRAAQSANVIMLGWVPPETIACLMSVSAIGLAAYSQGALQSLPNKPFEYMAGRLAVVTSLKGELPELLERHRCGATYHAGDPASLAHAISKLSSNSSTLAELRQNSGDLFGAQFHIDNIIANFADYLSEVELSASRLRHPAAA